MEPTDLLETLLEEVRGCAQQGDWEGAQRLLDQAPEPLRGQALYQFVCGSVAAHRDDFDAAVGAFERAVALEPEVAEFQGNLGAALLQRARRAGAVEPDVPRALEVLEHAAALSPLLPDVFNNLGLARSASGRPEQALEAFERALALDPSHLPALYNRAEALHLLGREEECLTVLEQVLAQDPTFAPAKESRERTLRRLGR
jgi:tetratricopeptide (TPR) repeat protein